jgi:hypothetical protein
LLLVAQKANSFGVVGLMNLLLFLVKKRLKTTGGKGTKLKFFSK